MATLPVVTQHSAATKEYDDETQCSQTPSASPPADPALLPTRLDEGVLLPKLVEEVVLLPKVVEEVVLLPKVVEEVCLIPK